MYWIGRAEAGRSDGEERGMGMLLQCCSAVVLTGGRAGYECTVLYWVLSNGVRESNAQGKQRDSDRPPRTAIYILDG